MGGALSDKDINEKLINGSIIISPLCEESIGSSDIAITASCLAWLIPNINSKNGKIRGTAIKPLDENGKALSYLRKNNYKDIISDKRYKICIPARSTVAIVANEAIYLNHEVRGSGKQIMDLRSDGLGYRSSPIKSNSANRLFVYLDNTTDKEVFVNVGDKIMLIHLEELKTPTEPSRSSNTNIEALLDDEVIPTVFKDNKSILVFLKCNENLMMSTMKESPYYIKISNEFNEYRNIMKVDKEAEEREKLRNAGREFLKEKSPVFFLTVIVIVLLVNEYVPSETIEKGYLRIILTISAVLSTLVLFATSIVPYISSVALIIEFTRRFKKFLEKGEKTK